MGQGLTAPGGRSPAAASARTRRPSGLAAARRLGSAHPLAALLAACVGLAAVSLVLPSTPTYDPWAWIVWGREILELDLDTRDGPSWKPLPVLFTAPFSLAGDAAPELWVLVARAGSLLAVAMAYRLGVRLGGGRPAGVIAAVALVLSTGFVRNAAIGNSEGLLIGLALFAIERHLDGRRDHALVLAFGAGLLRPEVWPFLGLYALVLFVREPPLRRLAVALMALLPVLWLVPEWWGSGDPLRASNRAQSPNPDSPAFAAYPALEVVADAAKLVLWPVLAGVLVAVGVGARAFATRRAHGPLLALAAAAAAWIGLVAVMTEAGYAGNLRYLALAGALLAVVGGAGVMMAARALARRAGVSAAATAAVATGLAALAVAPFALADTLSLHKVTDGVTREATLHDELQTTLTRAGGPDRLLPCGRPYTGPYQVPMLAWELHVHTGRVGTEARAPGVVFRARPVVPPDGEIAVPGGASDFRPVARTGHWQVFTDCRGPRASVPAVRRP